MPENIIRSVFAPDDYCDMAQYLAAWLKSNAEWDKYREKIPDALLDKWRTVLHLCAKEGFINPRVEKEKIVFSQILSRTRNRNADECTVCDNNIIAGTCKGKMKIENGKKTFHFCWE